MDESEYYKNKQTSLNLRELAFKTSIRDLQGVKPIGDYRAQRNR